MADTGEQPEARAIEGGKEKQGMIELHTCWQLGEACLTCSLLAECVRGKEQAEKEMQGMRKITAGSAIYYLSPNAVYEVTKQPRKFMTATIKQEGQDG
jgi:hypothetical protein